jgi:hypothetical protein
MELVKGIECTEELSNIIGYYNTILKNPLVKHIELFKFMDVYSVNSISDFIVRTKNFAIFWGDLMFPDNPKFRRIKMKNITKDIFNLLIEAYFISYGNSYEKNITSGDASGFLIDKDGDKIAIKNIFYNGNKEYLVSKDLGNFANESIMKYNLNIKYSNGKISDGRMMVFTTADAVHEMVKDIIYNDSILFYTKEDLEEMIDWDAIRNVLNNTLSEYGYKENVIKKSL